MCATKQSCFCIYFFFPRRAQGQRSGVRSRLHACEAILRRERKRKEERKRRISGQAKKKKSQELGGSKYTTFYFVIVCKYACMASRSKNQLKRRERCVSNENTCFPFFLVVDVVVETCFLCHAEGKQENKKKGKRGSALEVHAHYS